MVARRASSLHTNLVYRAIPLERATIKALPSHPYPARPYSMSSISFQPSIFGGTIRAWPIAINHAD
jgi:hypothetical protein